MGKFGEKLKGAFDKVGDKLEGTELGENLQTWASGGVPTKLSADKNTMTMVYVAVGAIVILAIAMFTKKR
jgi:hypothetical protein